jgi:hypothetical protein
MSLNNFQLEKLAKELNINLNGIVMKNELTFKRTVGNYIVNLDDIGNEGTHWCCLIVENMKAFWFDSYGCPPPQQIIDFCKNTKNNTHLYFNTRVIQDLDSSLCGFYCIAYLKYIRDSNKELLESSNDFCNMFDNSESDVNGYLLKGYLNKFNIKLKKYLFKHK